MNKLNLGVNEAKKIKNAVGWDKKKRKKEEKEPYSLGMDSLCNKTLLPFATSQEDKWL